MDQSNITVGNTNFLGSRRNSNAYDMSKESDKSSKSKPTNESFNNN
jgi:hypothetical protein